EIPVFSAVLTPQQFHESQAHFEFFRKHFSTKGIEVAEACANTLLSLERLRGQIAAGIPQSGGSSTQQCVGRPPPGMRSTLSPCRRGWSVLAGAHRAKQLSHARHNKNVFARQRRCFGAAASQGNMKMRQTGAFERPIRLTRKRRAN